MHLYMIYINHKTNRNFISPLINEDIIRRVLEIVTFLMLLQPTIFISTKNACIVFEFLTFMPPLTVF